MTRVLSTVAQLVPQPPEGHVKDGTPKCHIITDSPLQVTSLITQWQMLAIIAGMYFREVSKEHWWRLITYIYVYVYLFFLYTTM